MTQNTPSKGKNSLQHVLFGSLIGTTIEFFDFYIQNQRRWRRE